MSGDGVDDRLTRYLLGGLPPDDEEKLEREYLRGGEAYDLLLAAEDDLIDAYAGGRLDVESARRFEARFLTTPERRERVAFARALRALASSTGPAARPLAPGPSRWLLAAAALVPLLAAGWSVLALRERVERTRVERDAAGRALEESRSRVAALQESLALERMASKTASVSLSPGLERGSSTPGVLEVSEDVTTLRLRLRLSAVDANGPLRVAVETADGRPIASLHGLVPLAVDAQRVVDVHLPASAVRAGTYVALVEVEGPPRETVGAYTFRVARAR